MIGNIPKIVKYPKDVSVDLNSNFVNVTLTCEADGATSYNWKRHSGSIPSGAIGVNTNTLTIINLQPEDAGNYRCVATNASGSSYSEYATIIVKGETSNTLCVMNILVASIAQYTLVYVHICKNLILYLYAHFYFYAHYVIHAFI